MLTSGSPITLTTKGARYCSVAWIRKSAGTSSSLTDRALLFAAMHFHHFNWNVSRPMLEGEPQASREHRITVNKKQVFHLLQCQVGQ